MICTNNLTKLFLRIGLSFVFVYAAIEIYFHPDNFLKYVPQSIFQNMNLDIFLNTFGISEIILAIWILSGKKGVYSSLLSILIVMGIVAFNMEHFQILFRNIAIGFGAAALFVLEIAANRENRKERVL